MSAAASGPSIGATSTIDGSSDTLPSQYKILTILFNQDFTALTMGTMKAYFLFTINQNNKTGETHDCDIEPYLTESHLPFEKVRIIERLFSSSLIALVTDQAPQKLRVCHYQKGKEMCSYSFTNPILALRMNRSRLVVCFEESIWIYEIKTMKVVHTIRDIPSNPNGLCALSSKDETPYLAYPGSTTTGEMKIFDTIKLEEVLTISAHDGPLVAMSFDMSGTKIATASEKGTVIRVHNPTDGSRLFEFRRGIRRVATIYSLAFSPDSMFLAASSNTGTIHIFRLINPSEERSAWNRIVGGAAYYLPTQTSEVLTQDRSFATVHLKSGAMKTTIAMNVLNEKLILFVAAYDAVVSTYEVNRTDGGECPQISSQYLLSNMSVTQKSTATNSGQNAASNEPQGDIPPNFFKNANETVLNPSASTNDTTY